MRPLPYMYTPIGHKLRIWAAQKPHGSIDRKRININLETAFGDGKLTQPFNSESFPTGGPFTIWECGPPVGNDSELKSCITLPSRTAVSRINNMNPFATPEPWGASAAQIPSLWLIGV